MDKQCDGLRVGRARNETGTGRALETHTWHGLLAERPNGGSSACDLFGAYPQLLSGLKAGDLQVEDAREKALEALKTGVMKWWWWGGGGGGGGVGVGGGEK